MVVRCPNCKNQIRLEEPETHDNTVRYLCSSCEQIVMINLLEDEVPTSSSAPHPPVPKAKRILIADDSAVFLQLVKDLLEEQGFSVLTAHDGVEALKKISEERPDAVIMDLSMPGLTGFEVLRALRTSNGYKHCKNIPVLVTSGVYNPAEIEIIREFGGNGFINKEAVLDSLVYRIKKLIA